MSSEEFIYYFDCEDILNEAKFDRSKIIVEGEYDFIYEYIADSVIENHYEITTVEALTNRSGNKAVENLMLEIERFAEDEELEYIPHVLGIIDRDYREYENHLTDSKILYILEYYSIESYFVNREICYKILRNSIRSKRLINYTISNMIYDEVALSLLNELYENSIDKLQKHLEIDEVENLFNINKNFEILFKITKGKDLLTRFLVKFQTILSSQDLYKRCMNDEITVCTHREQVEHKKFCLYLTMKYDIHQLRKFVMEQTDISTLTPIKNRIKKLK